MCRFKSGLILKNRCVVAPEDNDSHSDLLESLNIEDTRENAMRMFVRAELIPKNNKWWNNPSDWEFVVDQDILPDWFTEDKGKYEEEFRNAVISWWNEHVIVDKKIEELSSGFYRLKRCEVKRLCKDVKALLDNATVTEMCGNATVTNMCGNATVTEMWDNATVTNFKNKSKLVAKNHLPIVEFENKVEEENED